MALITPILLAPQYSTYIVVRLINLGGDVYGGTQTGQLLKWNGVNAWIQVAPQLPGYTSCNDLAVYNSKIYMSSTGGVLLEWNGVNAWVAVSSGPPGNSNLFPLYVFNSILYGGGYAVNNGQLYKWNDVDAWVLVATKLNTEHTLRMLIEYNSSLWVFTDSIGYLGELVGSSLVQKATGYGGTITPIGLVLLDGEIYGTVTETMSLKKWDGASAWETVIPDLSPKRSGQLFIHSGEIHNFSIQASGEPLKKWDGVTGGSGSWIDVTDTQSYSFIFGMSFSNDIYIAANTGALYLVDFPEPPLNFQSSINKFSNQGDIHISL